MKTKLLAMIGAVGMMFATSACTDDLSINDGGQNGDLIQVTFTIAKESGVKTRADLPGNNGGYIYYPEANEFPQISDGSKAKKLIWAVYDSEGNLLPELGNNYAEQNASAEKGTDGQVVEVVDKFPHTITITLVRGQEYSFAFWAQDPDCKAFSTGDLRGVKIDYSSLDNTICNDELRDAFCKVETFTVTSAASMTRDIILRRPFAQINVGIPKDEYEALKRSGVRIKQSQIHIENVATEFDVVGNSTHGENSDKRQAIDYSANWIPAYYNYMDAQGLTNIPTDEQLQLDRESDPVHGKVQDLKIDLNKDGKIAPYGQKNGDGDDAVDETYNYMLMAYILPADRNEGTSTYSTTLDKVSFSLIPEDAGQQPLTMELENVPVQRNWRTNIFGRMFTSEVTLRIDLDPFYAGDYNYPSWERIYEGVFFETINNAPATRAESDGQDENQEYVIHISNGAGLIWLSNATNGVWPTKEEFEQDNTHNTGANLKNSADLMIKAANLTAWPADGLFHFKDVTIKLDADIDLDAYASLFGEEGEEFYFTPIGFGGDYEQNTNLNQGGKFFSGHFDGQNHTIYNLKTKRPANGEDNSSMGLFGVIGREASIRNVRLKNVDILGHYRTGGIVGHVYGPIYSTEKPVVIDNCYVDGGNIEVTSTDGGANAKDVAGICGIAYNTTNITNCFVRNVTIRGYRTIGGIIGQTGGDYRNQYIGYNNVYNCTLIADWFQYYSSNRDSFEIENIFIGEALEENTIEYNNEGGNKVYAFWWKTEDGVKTTEIGRDDLLSNPPLDIFPRMAYFTNKVHFQTSIMGGPSAYKVYSQDIAPSYKGVPDFNSGRVGLWVSGIDVDGNTAEFDDLLDNSTITATGLQGDKDCVLFIKDQANVSNLTIRGADYANEGICLSPAENETIKLTNVLSYDAKKVLTDGGSGNKSNLVVTGSNFRGYVSLGSGYGNVSFDNTIFEGSTKIYDTTINKLESASPVKLNNCSFIAPFIINVAANSEFTGCKAKINNTNVEIDITGNGEIQITESGELKFIPAE